MLSQEQNIRVTHIEDDALLGRLMKNYWIPLCRTKALEAGGAPQPSFLFGKKIALYRSPEGIAVAIDAACPHRCSSLLLARNEEGGLRCIFHGWKFAPDGSVIDVPTEAGVHAEGVMKRVKARTYPVREAGGLVFVYGGDGEPPVFPEFEFMTLPESHVDIRIAKLNANWLQTMESIIDTAHLGFLHRSSVERAKNAPSQKNQSAWFQNTAPVLEFEHTSYGFREAAKRALPDGRTNVRIREIVAPWHTLLAGEEGAERQQVITVPLTNHQSLQIIITFNPFRPITEEETKHLWFDMPESRDDFNGHMPGPDKMWGQDRAAMAEGHFSGLTNRHVFHEDLAVLESMGSIVDRSKEHLSRTDMTLMLLRKKLLEALADFEKNGTVWCADGLRDTDFNKLRTAAFMLSDGEGWKSAYNGLK